MKINVKLTIDEIQTLAIITAEKWIKKRDDEIFGLNPLDPFPEQTSKMLKTLSEKLFSIYRINKK